MPIHFGTDGWRAVISDTFTFHNLRLVAQAIADVFLQLAVLAFFLPTALLTLTMGRLWNRLERWPWRASIQRGLAPVSIGLIIAGCLTLARVAVTGWIGAAVAVGVFVTMLQSRINPALLVLAGALIGLVAFGRG